MTEPYIYRLTGGTEALRRLVVTNEGARRVTESKARPWLYNLTPEEAFERGYTAGGFETDRWWQDRLRYVLSELKKEHRAREEGESA